MGNKCGFIGHRNSFGLEKEIYTEIKALIETGVTDFYSGGMGNFDKMCEQAVKALGGTLTFVPYNQKQIKKQDGLWYDHIICPFGNKPYSRFDIPNRNRWLVKHCDLFLCYVYKDGGAKRTLDNAIKQNKRIINLAAPGSAFP